MTKTDIVNSLAESMELSKAQSKRIVEHILGDIEKAIVSGDTVQLTGFGTFKRIEKAGRTMKLSGFAKEGSKKKVNVPDRYAAKFTAGKSLKDSLDKQHKRDKK